MGEIGCPLVENKPLPIGINDPLLWHIDRFDSAEHARATVTPVSVALEAHGSWWLLSIEPTATDHHRGTHINQVAPATTPACVEISLLVFSAYISADLTSRVHLRSGIEAFYVIDGQQCLATEMRAFPMKKNDILVLPTRGYDATNRQWPTASTSPRGSCVGCLAAANHPHGDGT